MSLYLVSLMKCLYTVSKIGIKLYNRQNCLTRNGFVKTVQCLQYLDDTIRTWEIDSRCEFKFIDFVLSTHLYMYMNRSCYQDQKMICEHVYAINKIIKSINYGNIVPKCEVN